MYNDLLVYDVGMHNGDDTDYYLSKGYKVISIEADPVLAEKGKERFKASIETGQLQILNIGVGSENGLTDFYINDANPVWNSFDLSISNRDGKPWHAIKVQTCTFDKIICEYGVPYYLKADIEGNDYLCVENLAANNLPRYISVEANDDTIIELLATKGFSKFKLIYQHNLAHLDPVPNKYFRRWLWAYRLRLGNSIFKKVFRKFGGRELILWLDKKAVPPYNKKFKQGSSGNFGKELGGKWYPIDETLKIFRFYHTLFHNLPDKKDYGFWVDVHATW